MASQESIFYKSDFEVPSDPTELEIPYEQWVSVGWCFSISCEDGGTYRAYKFDRYITAPGTPVVDMTVAEFKDIDHAIERRIRSHDEPPEVIAAVVMNRWIADAREPFPAHVIADAKRQLAGSIQFSRDYFGEPDNGATTLKDCNFPISMHFMIANDPAEVDIEDEDNCESFQWCFALRWLNENYLVYTHQPREPDNDRAVSGFTDPTQVLHRRFKDEGDAPSAIAQTMVDRWLSSSTEPWPPHVTQRALSTLAEFVSEWRERARARIDARGADAVTESTQS